MSDWEPIAEVRTDAVSAASARALHDLLDRDGSAPSDGDDLPMLWHWLAFLPQSRQAELSPDGHPPTGGFLPPSGGRPRMYAGGRVEREGTVLVGEELIRTSSISGIADKAGRSGDLRFVTVDHRIESSGAAPGAISERSDIVYRERSVSRSGAGAEAPAAEATSADWSFERTVPIDPTLLFRFSALTYNAHRIHYDREYAERQEGHLGLVVHGPLQAILLADLVERTHPGRLMRDVTFRSVAPAYDLDDIVLRARAGDTSNLVELAAFSAGRVTMTATATLDRSR